MFLLYECITIKQHYWSTHKGWVYMVHNILYTIENYIQQFFSLYADYLSRSLKMQHLHISSGEDTSSLSASPIIVGRSSNASLMSSRAHVANLPNCFHISCLHVQVNNVKFISRWLLENYYIHAITTAFDVESNWHKSTNFHLI